MSSTIWFVEKCSTICAMYSRANVHRRVLKLVSCRDSAEGPSYSLRCDVARPHISSYNAPGVSTKSISLVDKSILT